MLVNFGSFLRARARKGLQDEGSGTVKDVSEISQMLKPTKTGIKKSVPKKVKMQAKSKQ